MASTDESYLAYDTVEISNLHRVKTYVRGALNELGQCAPSFIGECGCPADVTQVFTNPEADDAPWYDAAVPESADFLGLWLTTVVGLDGSPLARSMQPSTTAVGGSLGRLRLGPREMVFSGTLWATSDCGMDYGRRWLTEALKGRLCAECTPGEMCVRVCCPPGSEESEVGLRHLFGVGLLDAPTFSPVFPNGECCDHILQVTWTMGAEVPWLYDEPSTVLDAVLPSEPATCFVWCDDRCPEPVQETACAAPAQPPQAYCEPWERGPYLCAAIPAQPDWRDAATVFTVESGTSELVNLVIKVWEGVDCADIDDTCAEPCAIIGVRYLPASHTLIIDGRRRRVDVRCPGGQIVSGDRYVTGGYGPVPWVDGNCAGLSVAAYAAVEDLAANARLKVEVAGRIGG